jgi:hypothetical protein
MDNPGKLRKDYEGNEKDLRELKTKRWRQKANNREEQAFAVKEAMVLRGW